MTPERLAEIRDRVTYNPEDWPITIELVAHIDTITAENERLKGEVERLRKALAESAGAEVKAYDKLDALVTAGEKGIDAYCALCDVLSYLPTCIEDIVEDYQTHSDNIDALAAAVAEAKGK